MLLKKAIYSLLGVAVFAGMSMAYLAYYAAFKSNVKERPQGFTLYVYPDDSRDMVFHKLDTILEDPCSFIRLSKVLRIEKWKTGKYILKFGQDNLTILKKLRNGIQDPVHLTFNNVKDLYELSAVLGQQLMLDSADFVKAWSDSIYLAGLNLQYEKLLCRFVPNTYQVYWNWSPDKILTRIIEEHNSFWEKKDRIQKAKIKGLSPDEIYILASIVEKETNVEDEKGLIASVYLNRLKQGMKLQADPTVVYALGREDIYRVLLEHLKVESPYNTYLNEGLPPGPIFMPSISTIDSVLDSPPNDYLFFCAKPGYEGRHAFAETLRGHSQNAVAYRRWLDKQKIR
ncbi:MAG: endolytic transglycosylase MltG [Saprospiraceae bacterium]|nr:endolytic transglycosylase MltG [Saprospiraceae bacterium]